MFSQLICNGCSKNIVNAYLFVSTAVANEQVLEVYLDSLTDTARNITEESKEIDKYSNVIFTLKEPKHILNKTEEACGATEERSRNTTDEKTEGEKRKLKRNITRDKNNQITNCPKYICAYCGYDGCSSKHFLISHIRRRHADPLRTTHIDRKAFLRCYVCPATFDSAEQLFAHLPGHERGARHACEVCARSFASRPRCSRHRLSHVDADWAKKHRCPHCAFKTAAKAGLEAHVNRQHLKVAPYQCAECGRRFLSRSKLRTHRLAHVRDEDKRLVCSHCGRRFAWPGAFKKHLLRKHSAARPFACAPCGKAFIDRYSLRFHTLTVHAAKAEACPLCDKRFGAASRLRMHVKEVHWKRRGKFDHTQLEGLSREHYALFRDRRLVDFGGP